MPVTLLFADVEARNGGSSHDVVVARVAAGGGGRVVGHAGPGIACVMPTVAGAVAAALDIQRTLGAGSGASDVRIAIAVGSGTERDGRLTGPVVRSCEQLCEAAHGGQVVCTQAAADEVLADVPAGATVVELGPHRLHGLARAERIFQLAGPGAEPAFPPLRTVPLPRHNLPTVPTSFVGRDAELAELAGLLEARRLVTLTGAGGSGKTRLALELAAEEAHRFPDGVFFVDLASVADDDGMSSTLAQAVGSSGGTAQRLRQAALALLCPRRSLVVLDNCEHLLDEAAALADALVACSNVTVLATSREALGTLGEQVYPVSPLETDAPGAAMRLFRARASAVRPDFPSDGATDEIVTEICRRLDGLPLAIELAAARAAHLSPTEMLSRLDDRFRLLSGTRRRIGRHQTLRAAMDWSYDLLDDAHRALLRRLAVFSGTFTVGAAQGICAGEAVSADLVLDLLASLVSKSLVVADVHFRETRYRLLETVRDYAAERLAGADEPDDLRTRHRDWYLAWAESFPLELSMMSDTAAESFERDWDNLRASLDWSLERGELETLARLVVAVGALWRNTIRVAECGRWTRAIADAADDFAPDLRVAILSIASYTATMRLEPEVLEWSRRATAVDAPASPWLAEAWAVRSIVEGVVDPNGPGAAECAARAVTLADAFQAKPHAAHVWLGAGLGLIGAGRLPDATELFERALAVLTGEGATYDYATLIARSALACLYHLRGDHADALRVIRPAVDRLETRGWSGRPIAGIGAVAAVLAGAGETEWARALVRRDLHEGREALPLAQSDDALGLGVVAACEHDWEKASRLLAASVALGRAEVVPFRSPYAGALYARYVASARERLGAERARRCRDEGRAMTAADVFAYGLAPAGAERPVLRRLGSVWELTYRGRSAHVKHGKGLQDLERLIGSPGQAIGALDLLGAAPGSSAETIDNEGRTAYRRRIAELEAEIEGAERSDDDERATRARAERDAIVAHLSAALGIGGRPRRLGDAAESARKTVSTRLRDAIRNIEVAHPELGAHLQCSIRTGTKCVYEPDSTRPAAPAFSDPAVVEQTGPAGPTGRHAWRRSS